MNDKENENVLCPFCSAPWSREMLDAMNGTYGCETGCDYVRIVIRCSGCEKVVYVKGEFGDFRDEEEKKTDYLNIVSQSDIKEAAERRTQITL